MPPSWSSLEAEKAAGAGAQVGVEAAGTKSSVAAEGVEEESWWWSSSFPYSRYFPIRNSHYWRE